MTIEGTDPSLPSLLLNSHTDVVPVYPVSTFNNFLTPLVHYHQFYFYIIPYTIKLL